MDSSVNNKPSSNGRAPGYHTFQNLDGAGSGVQSSSGRSTPQMNASRKTTTKTFKRSIKNVNYWTYYIPILSWLPEYSWRSLPGDIAAGLTVRHAKQPLVTLYQIQLTL
jgi:hypothetical protein